LREQVFEVLVGGNERITIRLTDGSSMYIPRGWTDADRTGPQHARARDSFLTIDALRRLIALVEALLSRGE
jgi:hypothetical protein